ncbi:MAG TPA: V-type ATPase 116kDa subunit family protein [Trueperaceae bacterium]|nr:V-type ATPase 116kDa subunit family protein [Trueperaceae bacterium]
MIAKMDQVTVVGRRSGTKEVLSALQNLGVVQITPLAPQAAAATVAEPTAAAPTAGGSDGLLRPLRFEGVELAEAEAWDRILARTTALLDVLDGPFRASATKSSTAPVTTEIEPEVNEIAEQIERLVAERAELRDEHELIRSYLPLLRDLAPMLAQVEESRYLAGVPFMVAEADLPEIEAQLRQEFGAGFVLASRPHRGERLVVAAVLKSARPEFRSALAHTGTAELTLPDRYSSSGVAKTAHVMEERSQAAPKRLDAIAAELGKLAEQHGERLSQIHQHALNITSRHQAAEGLLEGRYSFALRGWVPADQRQSVLSALERQFGGDIATATRPADEHHDTGVPVKLDNPAWVRPFQGLLSLFAPPKYGSFDPSWTLAVFFPLYFGLVVGDMGFGLLFAVIALLLRRRGAQGKELDLGPLSITIPAPALKPISTIILWCAGWAIVWGFLYGEFFGNFLERFPAGRPIFYTTLHHEPGYGLINVPLFRVEVFTPLLLLCIGFGVLQVLSGWVIRVIQGLKHRDMKHVYEGIGMFAGLTGIVVFAAAYLMDALTPVALGIAGAGLAIFVVGAVLAKMPLMLVEIISNSGHILSFLRLFAAGLSAALVANLATDLGFGIAGILPVLGPILGIVVALGVHTMAIALTIIGHTLQPLRLQYVEFFTKFGFYDEAGRPYTPFRLVGGK